MFRWVKDIKVEANLRAMGVPFEIQTGISLTKVDLEEGIKRQKRLINKLNEDAVLAMAIDMAKPDAAFPMPILQKPPHGNMWPWSGNHRLASFTFAFPEATTIDAYLVTVKDPVMLDLLPRVVNAWESQLGFSKEEKVANALWMVENHSMPAAEAAQLFGVKVDWLWRTSNQEETKQVIQDIPGTEKLTKSVLFSLHPLISNTNVVRSLARLLVTHAVKNNEANHIIADVKKQRTENQMLGELARWERIFISRNEPKKREKGSVSMTRTVRGVFLRNITGLAKVLEGKDSLTKLQITDPADIDVMKRAWATIRWAMGKIDQDQ